MKNSFNADHSAAVGGIWFLCCCALSLIMLTASPVRACAVEPLPDDLARGDELRVGWIIRSDGEFVIYPKHGSEGLLPDLSDSLNNGVPEPSWDPYRDLIKTARFEGNISAFKGVATNGIERLFSGCKNLIAVDWRGFSLGEYREQVTSFDGAFSGCSSLVSIDLSALDTSEIESASGMFEGCASLKSFTLGDDWNPSLTTDYFGCDGEMGTGQYWSSSVDRNIVYHSRDIPSGVKATYSRAPIDHDLNTWYSSFECKWMVDNAGTLRISPIASGGAAHLGNWVRSASAQTDSPDMLFPGWCVSNLSGLIERVRVEGRVACNSCQNMFAGLENLNAVDFGTTDFSASRDMRGMFKECESVRTLDLSWLSTAPVEQMDEMFSGCRSIAELNLTASSFLQVKSVENLFADCTSLNTVEFAERALTNVKNLKGMYRNCASIEAVSMSFLSVPQGEYVEIDSMFEGCSSLKSVDFSTLAVQWSFFTPFADCPELRRIVLGDRTRLEFPKGLWMHMESGEVYSDADSFFAPKGEFIRIDQVDFTDVDTLTPHHADISWLASSGVSEGYPDGTFRPYDEVARCDMAAFLYRLAGSPAFEPSAFDWLRFSDVNSSTPHVREVLWLASEGISTGYPDGTFRPYASVARCDMAAFLHRMEQDASPSLLKLDFSDVDVSTPHVEDVAWLAAEGISTGYPDGTFRPYAYVVRCDMAAFLRRMEGRAAL